ncbi:NAD(P)(+)--arginine ADP-ribosyltransferase 2-like [Chelmon rostratus]|uniref:NAD(P)(+)--arginine ADP-ribosyltransferase 2-like n=1 Tax=Chelmon rostratus TaxID=109905 RepID=UPI001BEAEA28|nr:NAD(P)(+)--arginine ADP-ribosyltransferase 2-like [Chelmon rostratus]XP_041789990.1 NAD(P)(+)--arginine ADP-ribosyltransferase 2-like [Chelmon rostratus]
MTVMKAIFAPLCFLLCWMLPVDSMTIRFNFTVRDAVPSIPLSMVEDSVDDMYFGCKDAMMKIVKYKYIKEEKHIRPFADVWSEAEKCAKKKLKHTKHMALTKDHIKAICAYTSDKLYRPFNTAVRTEKSIYGSSFQFHSLHFLLTSAIQILNSKYYCHTTYRRASVRFTGKVHQIIRFGSFASSSYSTDLTNFGNETCFKIKTCSGASLKSYSMYDDEEEVLIPPYEMFKITEIINGKVNIQGLNDCKVVYVLESAGVRSNLNCKLLDP